MRIFLCLAFAVLAGCAGPLPESPSRVAVLGDSMMAWNGLSGQSAAHAMSTDLGEPVSNFSVSGARLSHPFRSVFFDVRKQYRDGPWEMIVVNGGANDFFFECACNACGRVLDSLIDPTAQNGSLVAFLKKLHASGAQVAYVGYHRSRGLSGPAKRCRDELDALDARVAHFAERYPRIHFVSLQTVFPVGDARYYAFDRIHPSPLGSAAIGRRISEALRPHLSNF